MTTPEPENMQGTADDWTRQWVASSVDYSVFLITSAGKIASWNPGGARIEGY